MILSIRNSSYSLNNKISTQNKRLSLRNNYYEIVNLTKKNITKYKTKNVNVQYKYHNDVQANMVRLRCI